MTRSRSLLLHEEIRSCRLCAEHLPHEPRPVVSFSAEARVVLIGQAPGAAVHASGIPWDDPSGDTLRTWMGLDRERFYDPTALAIVPMGFCYPGRGRSGDRPPRPECAPRWHQRVLGLLEPRLTLLIGRFAQEHYLGPKRGATLTQTVQQWRRYGPTVLPLPHPSPRNRPWLANNPWFQDEVIPVLRRRLRRLGVR